MKYMNKKRKVWVFSIVAAVIIILLIVFVGNNQGNEKECYSDSDCIKQRTGCCSCKMGGEEVCISKKNLTFWQEKIAQEGKEDMICTAVYNCRETSCLCKEGKCAES